VHAEGVHAGVLGVEAEDEGDDDRALAGVAEEALALAEGVELEARTL